MNDASGFREVRSSFSRSPSYRFPEEQRHQLGTGSWSLLGTPQSHQSLLYASVQTEKSSWNHFHARTASFTANSIKRTKVPGSFVFLLLVLAFHLWALTYMSTSGLTQPLPEEIVTLEKLEITQGIQTDDNTAPLIADRKTLVRAFFTVDHGTELTITARLAIKDPSGRNRESNEETVRLVASRNSDLAGRRLDKTASLNFVLHDSWVKAGTFAFYIVGNKVVNADGHSITCTNCGTYEEIVQFIPATTLRLRIVKFAYTKGGKLHYPSPIDEELVKSWLMRAYPIAHLDIQASSAETLEEQERFFLMKDCEIPSIQLNKLRFHEVYEAKTVDKRTRYVGLVPDSGLLMRGCAFASSGAANSAIPAVVPTGPDYHIWDEDVVSEKDGSYGDWYVGHELSHTFGLLHVHVPDCGNAGEPFDKSEEMRGGLIKGKDGDCVGLDMGDSSLKSRGPLSLEVLDGNKYYDVRTYCGPFWISSYTYVKILCRLYKEDSVAVTPLCRTPGVGQLAPPVFFTSLSTPLAIRGSGGSATPHLFQSADRTLPRRTEQEISIDTEAGSNKPIVTEDPTEQLFGILGIIEYIKATKEIKGRIVHTQKLSSAMDEPSDAKKQVSLRFLDKDGNPIKPDLPVGFEWREEKPKHEPEDRTVGLIRDVVKLPREPVSAVAIVWIQTGQVLDTRNLSDKLPTLDDKSIGGKKTLIEALDPLDISWAPAQVSGLIPSANVTYTVAISQDNGTTWQTVAIEYKPPASMVTSGKIIFTITDIKIKELQLEHVTRLKVKIVANDGFHSSEVTKDLTFPAGPG